MVSVTVTVAASTLAVTVTVMNPFAPELGCEFAELVCAEDAEGIETLPEGAIVGCAPEAPVSCSAIVGLTRKAVES
jgi:hypothetical protein